MEINQRTNRYSNAERETHIWFDYETKMWTMESNIPKHFNKALRAGWTPEKKYVYEDGTVASMLLTSVERGVSIRIPEKQRTREMNQNSLSNLKYKNKIDNSED